MTQYPRLIAVRVDDATHKAFHAAARLQGATASDLLRAAVLNTVASAPFASPAPVRAASMSEAA